MNFFLFFIWNQSERQSQDAFSPFPTGPWRPARENSAQMKWGPFWCPLPDSFENYFTSITMETLCLEWWMGSIWKRMTWNLKNGTSAGGQTFFLSKVDMSLKYSTDDCSIIFLSRKKSVAVLYQHALGGRKPILKLKWILFPFLKRTWRSLRSEFVHSVTQQLIERLLQGGYWLEAGDTKMNWMQALPLGNPEPSRDWQVNRSLQSSAGWRG